MKKSIILTIACFFICESAIQAQVPKNELSDLEKKMVNALFLLNECKAIGDYWLTMPGKIELNEKNELKTQELYIKSTSLAYGPFDLTGKYDIKYKWENGKLVSVNHESNVCRSAYDFVYLVQGQISFVRSGVTDHVFEYDESNKVVNISNGPYENRNKMLEKEYYHLEYYPSGKLKKIQLLISKAKEKKQSDPIEIFNYSREDRIYDENNPYKIRCIRYKKKESKNDKEIVVADFTIEYKMEDKKEVFTLTNNEMNKIVEKRVSEFDHNGKIVKTIRFVDGVTNNQEVDGEYDQQGRLIKTEEKEISSEGKTIRNVERTFTYKLKENAEAVNCNYIVDEFIRHYNEKGEAVVEISNGKVREKEANGEWGPWRMQRL